MPHSTHTQTLCQGHNPESIEAHFKAPTYFIPVSRFDDLVDFLHAKIGNTILGKRNNARGHRNYETFDEFQLEQSA